MSYISTYIGTRTVQMNVRMHAYVCHWWFNYPSPLLDVELEFACLSG